MTCISDPEHNSFKNKLLIKSDMLKEMKKFLVTPWPYRQSSLLIQTYLMIIASYALTSVITGYNMTFDNHVSNTIM